MPSDNKQLQSLHGIGGKVKNFQNSTSRPGKAKRTRRKRPAGDPDRLRTKYMPAASCVQTSPYIKVTLFDGWHMLAMLNSRVQKSQACSLNEDKTALCLFPE